MFLTVAGCFGGCRGRSVVAVKGAWAGERWSWGAGRAGDRRGQSGRGKRTGDRATAGRGLVLSHRQGTRWATLITRSLLHTENLQVALYSGPNTWNAPYKITSAVYLYAGFGVYSVCLCTPVSLCLCGFPRRLVRPDLPLARQERPPRYR